IAGDYVLTELGKRERVRWVGRRRINCQVHPTQSLVWPVRSRANAFGPSVPERDLLLSPQHAIYDEGVFIPTQYLINGSTIVVEKTAEVEYYHVELVEHGVLIAEGLPAESYLDTGNRNYFGDGGGPIFLHPDFSSLAWDARSYADLKVVGPEVDRVRAKLARQAELCLIQRSAATSV